MTTMLGPPHPVAMPTVTKTDKLRLAAAKGELDAVRDLLASGTPLQPDKVGLHVIHIHSHYILLDKVAQGPGAIKLPKQTHF